MLKPTETEVSLIASVLRIKRRFTRSSVQSVVQPNVTPLSPNRLTIYSAGAASYHFSPRETPVQTPPASLPNGLTRQDEYRMKKLRFYPLVEADYSAASP